LGAWFPQWDELPPEHREQVKWIERRRRRWQFGIWLLVVGSIALAAPVAKSISH